MDERHYNRNFAFANARFNSTTFIGGRATRWLGIRIARAGSTLAYLACRNRDFQSRVFRRFTFFRAYAGLYNFPFRFFIKRFFRLQFRNVSSISRFTRPTRNTVIAAARGFDWRFS